MEHQISELVREGHSKVVALRRHFRTFPELGGEEHKTQQKIIAELEASNVVYRKAAGTGVIAEIKGALPGKTVAIRADIDALPIHDEVDQDYRSQHAGLCHACGHDGHTAMLLGLVKVFASLREQLPGTVRFLFQPSEEIMPGGAKTLIAEGALDGVDAIIGAHVWQPLATGTVGVSYGAMMAAADGFTFTIQGRGGHGSMPHQTVDPLYIGAQAVVALKGITGNDIDAAEHAVLSLGQFKAGNAFNIIPDTAMLQGSVRTFKQAVREKIFARMEQIVSGICAAHGATYLFEPTFGYPPVINHPAVAKVAADTIKQVLGDSGAVEVRPAAVAEDFSYYLEQVPGAFLFVGVGNKDKGIIYPHHHPKFDMDEDALVHGVEVLARTAYKLLTAK